MHIRHLFFKTWLALMVLLGLAGTALAQGRHGDDGDYQILQARYGTSSQNMDVTERLRDLARSDREFRVSNDVMGGDPHPGRHKVLRIYARSRDGQTRTFEYREDQRVDGAMFTGWSGGGWGQGGWGGGWEGEQRPGHHQGNQAQDDGDYLILEARYGTPSRNSDVTHRLKQLASQDRDIEISNEVMGGDPHPGQYKLLRIYARGPNGQTRTFEYREGQRVDGSIFVGWRGGNWGHGGWNRGWGEGAPAGGGQGELIILSARYGADGRTVDLTQQLRSLVRDDHLYVTADNRLAGTDPAPGRVKSLWVTYRIGRGAQQQVVVDEERSLRLP